MKVGNMVKMKEEPFPWHPYGIGFVVMVDDDNDNYGYVFFPRLVQINYDGLKWCHLNSLEVISESG